MGEWRLAGNIADEKYRCDHPCLRTMERCKNPAVRGTNACRKHGGTKEARIMAGLRRQLEERVDEWLRMRGFDL